MGSSKSAGASVFPACYASLYFVSFLTVALALRKPMKIVSRIHLSKQHGILEDVENTKKGQKRNGRKSDHRVFIWTMANVTGLIPK